MLGAVALSIGASATALAQTAPAAPSGPLTIERVEQGFVFAPDARITEVDGRTAPLAGGYAGWMTDRTWLVGAGGYWLASQDDDLEMAYGGLVVEYLARSQERIGFGVRGLVGGGSATLGFPIAGDTPILVQEYFFVVEPQASVAWHFTRWARLDLGIGYRLTAGAGSLDEELRGPSASVAIQFGGGKRK